MLPDAVKRLSYLGRVLATVVLGSVALAMALALIPPAASSIGSAATPIGDLDLAVTAPAARSIVYDRYGGVIGSFALEDRQRQGLLGDANLGLADDALRLLDPDREVHDLAVAGELRLGHPRRRRASPGQSRLPIPD